MRFRQLFLLFLFCTVPAVQAKDRDSSRRPSNRNRAGSSDSKALVKYQSAEEPDDPPVFLPAVPDAPTHGSYGTRCSSPEQFYNLPACPDPPSPDRAWGSRGADQRRRPPITDRGRKAAYGPPPPDARRRRQSDAAYGPSWAPPPADPERRGRSSSRDPYEDRPTGGRSSSTFVPEERRIRLQPGYGNGGTGGTRDPYFRPTTVAWDQNGNPIYRPGISGSGSSSPASDYRRGSVSINGPPLATYDNDGYRRPGSSGSFGSQRYPPSSSYGSGPRTYNPQNGQYGPGYRRTW